jgi:hypothetical protein
LPPQFSETVPIENWQALQTQWQNALQTLAQQFIDGYATVGPKAPNTCDFCALDSICRYFHEAGADERATNADESSRGAEADL